MSNAIHPEPLQLSDTPRLSLRALSWQFALVTLAIAWLYGPIVVRLVGQWQNDANYSHGFFVPLFALFLVWQGRGRWASLPKQPSWWGFAILVWGLGVLTAGVIGAELFLSRVSLIFVLAGVIVSFLGWNYLSALWFPLAVLLRSRPSF